MIDIFDNSFAVQIFHGSDNRYLIVSLGGANEYTRVSILKQKSREKSNALLDECVAFCEMNENKTAASAMQVLREATLIPEGEWVAARLNQDNIFEIVDRGKQSFGEITVVSMQKYKTRAISVEIHTADSRLFEESKEAFEKAKKLGEHKIADDESENSLHKTFKSMGFGEDAIKGILEMNKKILDAKVGAEMATIISDGEKTIRLFNNKPKRIKKKNQLWNDSRIVYNLAA